MNIRILNKVNIITNNKVDMTKRSNFINKIII